MSALDPVSLSALDRQSVRDLVQEGRDLAVQRDYAGAVLCYRLLLHEPVVLRSEDLRANILGTLGMLRLMQADYLSEPNDVRKALDEAVGRLEQARALRNDDDTANLLVQALQRRHQHTGNPGDLLAANLIVLSNPKGPLSRAPDPRCGF